MEVKIRSPNAHIQFCSLTVRRTLADVVTPKEARRLRNECNWVSFFMLVVREMFYHALNGYMEHAFALDELRPLTCGGEDSLGGYALTLIDSLDMFGFTW